MQSKSNKFFDVYNPATQELVTRTPLSLPDELEAAVKTADKAGIAWREKAVSQRQRIMMKYRVCLV